MNIMNFGKQGELSGKSPAAPLRQPSRILVVDVRAPHWHHTCHRICEALENVMSLVGSLAGPPRIPLLSIYAAQSQPECLLPFVPVRGGFSRLQRCLAELRAFPTEGAFRPREDAVTQAVKDGLQQFKQFTRQSLAGASLSSSLLEVTVLTSQVGTEVVQQLEAGLQGVDMTRLQQLQVVVIGRWNQLPEPSEAEGISRARGEAKDIENSMLLGPAIDLQAVDNDLVSLETSFKAWLHDCGTDQEHLHLFLPPASAGAGPVCVKCDVQERLLDPALLPAAFHSSASNTHDATGPFWMAAGHGPAPRRLQAVRALKAEGLCASVLFGLPLVVRPTSCWRLNWEELEANQHCFQALCHGLRRREWVLLAQETGAGRGGPSTTTTSHRVLLPSDSSSLLLQSVVAQELLLPCGSPSLPDDLPGTEVSRMESILEGLPVEPAYNPLHVTSHLYEVLRSSLARPQASGTQCATERLLPRQPSSRQPQSKARAAVAPLRMAPLPASPRRLARCSGEEEDFTDCP